MILLRSGKLSSRERINTLFRVISVFTSPRTEICVDRRLLASALIPASPIGFPLRLRIKPQFVDQSSEKNSIADCVLMPVLCEVVEAKAKYAGRR